MEKSPRVQAVLARCEIELYSARCAVYSSLNEQWDGLVGKEPLSNAHRITVALARQQAFKVSRQIISTIYDLVGGASIYKNETPMDKWLRDSYTMNQHAVASESIVQQCGQFLLNNHSNNLFI
ncbi:acyl-CoA dehydrogenase family protein [Providencia rettgeri]|uniref:acyl-CoA dehydrogenase family protein n=1 Tax=Providencia rettgeri TaxID=587 RepID=UPI003D2F6352